MCYAQRCTRMEVIGDVTFADLAVHFEPAQIIEICLMVGTSNVINRFHAAFRTEVKPADPRGAGAGVLAFLPLPMSEA